MAQLSMHTPHGDLTIFDDDEGALIALDWGWTPDQQKTNLLIEAKRQLDLYFDGELTKFDLPLGPDGTAYQKKVWAVMNDIAYGQTMTYGDVAKELGSAPQAVGNACGANPLPIIQPCHRVLAAGGKIGGYSGEGGAETKAAFLALEGNRQIFDFY